MAIADFGKWNLIFRLTLKTSLVFVLDSEKECEEFKAKCLKSGIEATTQSGAKVFYPARRINQTEIRQIK